MLPTSELTGDSPCGDFLRLLSIVASSCGRKGEDLRLHTSTSSMLPKGDGDVNMRPRADEAEAVASCTGLGGEAAAGPRSGVGGCCSGNGGAWCCGVFVAELTDEAGFDGGAVGVEALFVVQTSSEAASESAVRMLHALVDGFARLHVDAPLAVLAAPTPVEHADEGLPASPDRSMRCTSE